MTDLLALTADLVDIASVSRDEQALADRVQRDLEAVPWLSVDRVGDNVVGRTSFGREHRLILAGHTDTVPPNGNEGARVDGDTLWGLGSADMKGGLAVQLELARTIDADAAAVDLTYVFYAREEIAAAESGLLELFEQRPDLLVGDVALLGEPTGGALEAGCQGSMRLELKLSGARAHTARPWMGDNAVHRLADALTVLQEYEGRRPVIDGCEYREALQAVRIEGGVAGNVVPDAAGLLINHRFAPDRTEVEAAAHVREVLAPVMRDGDTIEVVEVAHAAAPGLGHPLLSGLIDGAGLEVRAKLGWTDVSRFAQHGTPAANYGPGDSTLAHTAEEHVERGSIESVHASLEALITGR